MAGELIGALRVTLGLDTAQFETGSKKARATAKRDVTAIQREFDKLKGLGTAIAGIWAGSEIVAAGRRALDYASSLGEVAQQLGVSTKELQEYRYAASQAGVSQDEMDKGLAKLTRTIGEAKAGSKAQATTFRELGVAIQDANGRVYTAGEVIPKLADALSKIKDPATRARLEVDLFGKAGQKLDTMLAGGSQSVNELRDAAQSLGLVLSDQQIQNADDTADKLAAVKQVLEANIAGTVANNANSILMLANAFTSLTGKALSYVKEYPRIAAALAGAAVGARFGGGPGAAIGAAAGAWLGDDMARGADDQNMDIRHRLKRLGEARGQMGSLRKAGTSGGGLFTFRKGGQNTQGGDLTAAIAEVKRQTTLLRMATAAQSGGQQAAAVIADGALPEIAPSGGKKSGGRSGPTAAEIQAKHDEEMSQLRQEQLQTQLRLTTDAEKRADLQSQLLLEEYNERRQQIENDEHFTGDQKRAQIAALKALYGASGEGDDIVVSGGGNSMSAGVSRELQEQLAREAYDVRAADLDAQRDMLQGQLSMARTSADRRRIELEILDLEYKLREAKLDQVINSQESSQAEKDLATMAKGRLAGQRGLDSANIARQNMGPMAAYMDSLPKTAGEVNEAFEQIAANGLANMNDQLASAAANTLKLKGIAGQLFNQLIADVIRLNLQQASGGAGGLLGGLFKLGSSLLGGGGLGGVTDATRSALDAQLNASFASKMNGLPGLAVGGTIGGFPGVDKNLLSINGIPAARVSANERIRVEPNVANDNGRSAARVHVVPSPYFDVVVDQRAAGVAAPMASQAAGAGSTGAQVALARKANRTIP